MHHHADRAMIGIRRSRMNVRYLDKRHQGQQQQANERGRAHGPGPASIHSSDVPVEVHSIPASTRIHRLDSALFNLQYEFGQPITPKEAGHDHPGR